MTSAKVILEELNRIDEHQQIEAKHGVGKTILETICAFSNEPGLNGGAIIVGVKKDESQPSPYYYPTGIDNPDKISSDIASQCASVFNIPIRPKIHTEEINNKTVLVVTVQEAPKSAKPIYLKAKGLPDGAYRRIGSTDQKCTEDDLTVLFAQRNVETYDELILQGATIDDIDPDSVKLYRALRKNVNPTAEELSWNDEDLLLSLSAVKEENNTLYPTITGILLFGTRAALRRFLPMARVDYIRIPGKEWVQNPENRFFTNDMRGSLLGLVQRLHDQVYEDLPKAFVLEEGSVQASSQSLPARVLREAIVNALMHASYRIHQPIQILRYTNRIEIRNPGYSLKNEDQFGEAGSKLRNPKIAAIFHETNIAETKGSGIRTMRQLMQENGFASPTFESNRQDDAFLARLLLHHFLTPEDIVWLESQTDNPLNDNQKKALIFVREIGAIDNQAYRQLNAVDTITASSELRRLRDINLLQKKGMSAATYYIAGTAMKLLPETQTHKLLPETHKLLPETHKLLPETHKLLPETHKIYQLPEKLLKRLSQLKKSYGTEKKKELIIEVCTYGEWSASELTNLLKMKDATYVQRTYLKPLIHEKKLIYTFPDMVNHPKQKYTIFKRNKDIL